LNRCRKREADNPASAAQFAAVTGSPENRVICAIDRTTRGSSTRRGKASPKHNLIEFSTAQIGAACPAPSRS